MRIAAKPMAQGGAVSWFRVTGPAEYVREGGGHEVAILHSQLVARELQPNLVRSADVVHTTIPAGSYESAPPEWRERAGALSVDLDDDVWVWLDDPAATAARDAKMSVGAAGSVELTRERLAEVESWLRAADVVTTTTEALAETIRSRVNEASQRVRVVPNAVPPEAQRRMPRRADRIAASGVLQKAGLRPRSKVVGWTGSIAHVPDLTPALAALARIRSVDGSLEVRSLGPVDFMQSPGFATVFRGDTDYKPVLVRDPRTGRASPQAPFEVYYDTLEAMEPDVAVIPMRASPFNAGKSAVTLYSWGIQAVPVVCSRFGPYAEAEREGFPARYVDHEDREAWTRELRELLYDPKEAYLLGQKAKEWVLERHAFPRAAARWVEVWAEAVEARRGVRA